MYVQFKSILHGALLLSVLACFVAPVSAVDGEFVTPRDYGAVGNGVTNDRTAVQSALNTGKVIHLAGSSYRITSQLSIPAGGGIVGPGKIIHDFDPGLPNHTPSMSDTALYTSGDDVLFEGFTIEKIFQDGSYGNGITADHVKDLTIRDLDISGYSARYGIHIVESEDFEITGCHIHDFMMNADSDMIADSPAGLRITRSHRGIVAGNRMLNIKVGPHGLESISPIRPEYGPQNYQSDHMTIMQSTGVVVSGNLCVTSGEGIDMLLSNSCTLTGNVVRDIWGQGFKMLGVSFCSVSGNFLSDCWQGIGLYYHDVLETEASGNSVTGNVIRDNGSPGSFGILASARINAQTHAIDIHDPECRYNVVANNVIIDTQETKTTASGVRNNGGSTNMITNNLFTTNIAAP